MGLKHFTPESVRGGVVLWITRLKKEAQIRMPEESCPRFDGEELSEVRSIEATPEYRIVIAKPRSVQIIKRNPEEDSL